MFNTKIRAAFAAICLSFALVSPAAEAQGRAQAVTQTQAPTPVLEQNAVETRRQFYKVLDAYPPGLGRVLRLDPTLMNNNGYLASYPNVGAFLSQHPDVARNPGFYLERYDPNYSFPEPSDPKREVVRMWRDVLEFLGAFTVMGVIALALFTLIKYIVEYRRWHRISKVNAEVHNKILDRFGSNEELLAYIDSPAGRRFLEAAPMAPNGAQGRVAAPYGRILFSVQVGVILMGLSLGLMWVSTRSIEEVREVFMGLAIVGLTLGLGCVVSAAASYALSRRLGLLQDAPPARPPQAI